MMIDENELFRTKWFDYRLLSSPEDCTLAMFREWIRALDWALQRTGLDQREDKEGNGYRLPFVYQDASIDHLQRVNNGADWKAIEKVRRICDRRCLSYRLYADAATRAMVSLGDIQLEATSLAQTMTVHTVVDEVIESLLAVPQVTSSHPFFAAAGWIAHPIQQDYYRHVADKLAERYGSRATVVAEKLERRGKIHSKIVRKLLPENKSQIIY